MKSIPFPDLKYLSTSEEKFDALVNFIWLYTNTISHELNNLSVNNFNEKTLTELAEKISDILGLEDENATT